MRDKGSSENHQINNLKVIIDFTRFLGPEGFYEITMKDQITSFLNTKIKDDQHDPDKKWITTWNHYLNRIRLFFRWLHNAHKQKYSHSEDIYLRYYQNASGALQILLKSSKKLLNALVHMLKRNYGSETNY